MVDLPLNRRSSRALISMMVFAVLLTLPRVPVAADESIPANVHQVLADNCLKCHGEKKQSGKLDLRTLDTMRKGGKRGTAVVPASSKESRLVQVVNVGGKPHMPPGKKQLTDDEIRVLSNWVDGLDADPVRTKPPTDETKAEPTVEPDVKPNVESNAPDERKTWLPPAGSNPTSVINLFVSAGHTARSVTPNELCTDRVFARRIYLDLIGRIPTVAELNDFLTQTDSAKRQRLADQLIESDDFPKHFATCFDTMFLGRNERKIKQRTESGWHAYLETVFRADRPWNEVAREVLLARPMADKAQERGHVWFLYEHNDKHQQIAEGISRAFFGVDIQCAQCHDHPSADEIKQAHYWGLVSFFKRSKNEKSKNGLAVGESAIGGFDSYASAFTGTSDQAVLTFMQANTVEEARPDDPNKQEDKDELYINVKNEPRVPRFSRREKFVDEVLTDHPFLARAFVNRVWALLVGRGIVHPLDEMDSNHPPSHPALLQWLAEDFDRHEYRTKHLVRAIVLSQAYQLDSRRPDADPEPSSFTYGLEKPLTAEVMARSIKTAFQNVTAGESTSDDDAIDVAKVAPEFRKQFPEVVSKEKLTNLKQTLMLSNHPELQKIMTAAAVKMNQGSGTAENLQAAFERVYGRAATAVELSAIHEYLQARTDRPQAAMAQVLWALVTSAEFRFNH